MPLVDMLILLAYVYDLSTFANYKLFTQHKAKSFVIELSCKIKSGSIT